MARFFFGRMLAAGLAVSGSAIAQTPATAAPAPAVPTVPAVAQPASAAPVASAAPPTPAAGPVRRDPRGVTGISPFWEALVRGDAAFAARDFETAVKTYREAIEKEANNPLGHYRLGEAQLAKGELGEAELSWQAGLRFAGRDAKVRGKLIFVLADLRERQKNYDEASGRWKEYAQHAQSQPDGKGFPGTPDERQKRIEQWKTLSAASALVKERNEKRLNETDASMRKSPK